ncbi:hypothetical protein [Nocardia wallacei]|uniref:hypothetical protein n=1 Tax=Nocardia wallacei TaxID=480035 RepID=UPI0024590574|nr:hypothetical protein [Nocardia wallacei]
MDAETKNLLIGHAATLVLPAVGQIFGPAGGAIGGLIGGAVAGVLRNDTGWALVGDIAGGAIGGGLGGWFGKSLGRYGALDSAAGLEFGKGWYKFAELTSAGVGGALSSIGRDIAGIIHSEVTGPSIPASLPTVNLGKGDT